MNNFQALSIAMICEFWFCQKDGIYWNTACSSLVIHPRAAVHDENLRFGSNKKMIYTYRHNCFQIAMCTCLCSDIFLASPQAMR